MQGGFLHNFLSTPQWHPALWCIMTLLAGRSWPFKGTRASALVYRLATTVPGSHTLTGPALGIVVVHVPGGSGRQEDADDAVRVVAYMIVGEVGLALAGGLGTGVKLFE